MTIAAGFICSDGVVLCADTQEANNYTRVNRDKVVNYDKDHCKAAIAGSGFNGDLIDALVEKIVDCLDVGNASLPQIRKDVEATILDFYSVQIQAHPASLENKEIELLVAIKAKENQAALWKINNSVLKTEKYKSILGTGALLNYVVENFYRDGMPIEDAILLSVYILRTAKDHVLGCGGHSHVTAISNSHGLVFRNYVDLIGLEIYLSRFEATIRDLMFSGAKGAIGEEVFKQQLSNTVKEIFSAREQSLKWRETYTTELKPRLDKLKNA